MAKTQEPDIVRGSDPEKALRKAIIAEIKELLNQWQLSHSLVRFFILEDFGLDVAVFMESSNQYYTAKFLELKAFVGSRPGGIGFGNQAGKGSQVDLLKLGQGELKLADRFSRWIMVDGTKSRGLARFTIFSNSQAHEAAMNSVGRGKQNNLRIDDLMANAITWDNLLKELEAFLAEH